MPSADTLKRDSINDFRPGIYAQSNFALSGTALPTGKGYAQQANTYRCIALPNGGLAPLPRAQALGQSVTPPVDTGANVLTPYYVVGFHAYGPVLPTGVLSGYVDELHLAIEYIYNNAGTNQRRLRWQRLRLFDNAGGWDSIIQLNSAATGIVVAGAQFHGMSFGDTRMATASPFTAVGSPAVGTSYRAIGSGGEQRVWAYPDPSAPTANTPLALSTTQSGLIVAHEGRLVLATFVAAQSHGSSANASFNEAINYTDPPNSNLWPGQNSVYAPENPSGYGALSSVNTSELLMIKNKGGAVIVSGDLDAVSISRLPFVQSAGNLTCIPAVGPGGLYYLAYDQGLWHWSGGNSSDKVSNALNDDFAQMAPPFINVSAVCESWGDWVAISNNWLLDTNTGGFWRLEDPAVNLFLWFSASFVSSGLFAAPYQQAAAGNAFAYEFLAGQNATNYSWQSHPLPWGINRRVRVREIVVRAVNAGTVTITFSGTNPDSPDTANYAINIPAGATPQKIRHAASFSAEDIAVRIQSDGGASQAPTIFEIQFAYEDLQHLNAT